MQLQNFLSPRVYLLKKHNAAAKLALITKSSNANFATLCAYRRSITPYRHACIASSDQKRTKA